MSIKVLLAFIVGLVCSVAVASSETQTEARHKKDKGPLTQQSGNAPATKVKFRKSSISKQSPPASGNLAEFRLIGIYRLIGNAETTKALAQAEKLVNDYPNFALAQLVYGDLLSARTQSIHEFGSVPANLLKAKQAVLNDLRTESQMRIKALRERPPPDALPAELLRLSRQNKHAIAVDASRARLYLFENRVGSPKLVADFYISVGKLGTDKRAEGDLRTPLGVYFITSQLDPSTLTDFYGVGALPINYPNELDRKRGKTGKGIWLHGTPPGQFSRPPQDSDGCVVLANPDLTRIINTVEIRSTPVVIARQLHWVTSEKTRKLNQEFEVRLQAWLASKVAVNVPELSTFYSRDFSQNGKPLADWLPTLQRELEPRRGQAREIKDINLLHWRDTEETMVVTFGELISGQRNGVTRRQYWTRASGQWQIFYEGVSG